MLLLELAITLLSLLSLPPGLKPEPHANLAAPHLLFPTHHHHLQLLAHIKKDKQGDALIEKLCQRFAATDDPQQWHNIAFCLTQVRRGEGYLGLNWYELVRECVLPST